MDVKERIELSAKLVAAVPSLDDDELTAVLTIISDDRRAREDKISLQNIGIITVNAIKAKSHHPKKLLGAVTLPQLKDAGIPDTDIIILQNAMDEPE